MDFRTKQKPQQAQKTIVQARNPNTSDLGVAGVSSAVNCIVGLVER